MNRFRQFAAPVIAPVVLGAALCLGVGCSPERHAEIPSSAAEISEGTKTVSGTATQNGDVYIYDATDNKMVYSGKVQRGQVVKVDSEKNIVLLDGKTLTERDLPNDHHYKIFFDSSKEMTGGATYNNGAMAAPAAAPAPAPSGGTTVSPAPGQAVTVQPR